MEKKNKTGIITALKYTGLLFAVAGLLSLMAVGMTTPKTNKASAEGIGTLPDSDFYWNALNGYQITVNKNNTYAYTITVPTAPGNVSDTTQTNNVTWDDSENTYNFITTYKKGSTDEGTYASVSMRGYVKDILFWSTTPTVIEKESFLNSMKLQYFANSSLDANFAITFSYLLQNSDGIAYTRVYTYTTSNGNYYLTETQINDLTTRLNNEIQWQKIDGKEYSYILQSYINIEPYNGQKLGFNFEYRYYYVGRYGINNITQGEYIPLVSRFRHYEDIDVSGVFSFINTFFNTEIFSGFTFGTLLFIGVGGLLVGMLLKIFLGG